MIKNKKSIALMLAAASAVSLAGLSNPQSVYATEYNRELSNKIGSADSYTRTDKNGVSWVFCLNDDGTAFIEGATDITSDTLEVPQEIDGCTVVGIVEMIYGRAMDNASQVEKVVLPSTIKYIGHNSFRSLHNLKDINIPSGVEYFGYLAFPDEWINANKDSNGFVIINGILVDGHNCRGNVTIPSNVSTIGVNAFGMCAKHGGFSDYPGITGVTIPANVKKIEDEAFFGCKTLKYVNLAEGIEEIGGAAFQDCSSLENIKIPKSVKKLSDSTFAGVDPNKFVSADATYDEASNGQDISSNNKPTGTVSDWQCIDGKWYYINPDGSKQNGWFFDIRYGKWYYLGDDGARQIGWKYYAPYNSWFYLDPYDGARISGWFYDPNYGSWFFMNDNGTMKTGWMYDYNYGQWFYLNANGTMKTGWLYDSNDGNWYYLYSNGVMARSTRINGYYVNASGAWVH